MLEMCNKERLEGERMEEDPHGEGAACSAGTH